MRGKRVFASLVTGFIIFLLILLGPANALLLSLSVDHPTINEGEKISFILTANTNKDNETANIFILELGSIKNSSLNYICQFDINTTIISGCNGMTIDKLSEEYEYGYGYGNLEKVEFNVTLDTSSIKPGKYKTLFEVIGDKTTKKRGLTINIKEIDTSRKGIKDCSIRGHKGTLVVNGVDFGSNNKINFAVTSQNAAPGQGYLTGQKDRTTFSYNFKILEILNNSEDQLQILVSGTYRIGLQEKQSEKTIITLDKTNNLLSLSDTILSLEGMKVTFIKGC